MSSLRIPLVVYFALAAFTALGSFALALFAKTDNSGFNYQLEEFLPLFLLFFIILVPLVNILHRRAFQSGGLYLSAVFLGLWITGILAMFDFINSSRWSATLMIGLAAGIPAGVGLLFRKKHWGPPFAWSLCTLASIAAVIMLIPAWFDSFSSGGEKLYLIGSVILGPAIASMLLINVGCGDCRYFRWPAILAALLGMIINIHALTYESGWNDSGPFGARLCAIAAGTGALTNLLLMTRQWHGQHLQMGWHRRHHRHRRRIHGPYHHRLLRHPAPRSHRIAGIYDWGTRALFACIFLAMGVLCQLLARTMLHASPSSPSSPPLTKQVTLTCPNCNQPGIIPLKDGACPHCLLQFRITLIEPTCPKNAIACSSTSPATAAPSAASNSTALHWPLPLLPRFLRLPPRRQSKPSRRRLIQSPDYHSSQESNHASQTLHRGTVRFCPVGLRLRLPPHPTPAAPTSAPHNIWRPTYTVPANAPEWVTFHNDFYWTDDKGNRIQTAPVASATSTPNGIGTVAPAALPRPNLLLLHRSGPLEIRGVILTSIVDANRMEVLYNAPTKKYVMLLKYDGNGAFLGVATADKPEGLCLQNAASHRCPNGRHVPRPAQNPPVLSRR